MLWINEIRAGKKTMTKKPVWDMTKIPRKYNRKAKLHGAVKNVQNLVGWEKIIMEMWKGKKSPSDPYIEEILHDCIDVLKVAKNHEARRLTGLAKDLLLFSDLGEALILDEGWSIKISGTLELTRSLDNLDSLHPALSRRYMTYGYRDLLVAAAEDEMLNFRELCTVQNAVLNNIFVS